MRIGIDARFYGSLGKGLGRYTQKLIENLEKISTNDSSFHNGSHQFFVFLRKENFECYEPKNPNFHKVLADYQWYSFSEQIKMPRILNSYNLDLVHFPHFNIPIFYRKRFVITIHDLILLNFPTIRGTTLNPLWYRLKFLAYKITIRRAILKSEKIITVSNFTKQDILNRYNVPAEKIIVTYEASDKVGKLNFRSPEEILKKYAIIKPYLMYVGNAYPHKNLEALVSGFSEISQKNDLHLVLVGKEDYFYKKLKTRVKNEKIKKIIFADFVPDEDLDLIYRHSLFYIFPSLYEGFGLSPIEAMIRGVPVASSDHPCMKEVLGENAYFFDAGKKENIKKTILEMATNNSLRKELSRKGYSQANKYTWEVMAEKTKEIYEKIN